MKKNTHIYSRLGDLAPRVTSESGIKYAVYVTLGVLAVIAVGEFIHFVAVTWK